VRSVEEGDLFAQAERGYEYLVASPLEFLGNVCRSLPISLAAQDNALNNLAFHIVGIGGHRYDPFAFCYKVAS
jgi:hypothetical protein